MTALACTAAWARPVRADDRLREQAVSRYQAKEYGTAAGAFAASFATSGDFADLFAWAQSERLWGQCERAIELYSIFLSSEPPPANRAAATLGIDRCRGRVELALTHPGILATERGRTALRRLFERGYALSGEPGFLFALADSKATAQGCASGQALFERAVSETQSPVLAELARARLAACRESETGREVGAGATPATVGQTAGHGPGGARAELSGQSPPWYRDRWGGALAGGGTLATLAGGLVLYLGHRKVENADGPTYGAFAADVDAGRRLETAGVVALGAGVALIGLGVWRYLSRDGGVRVAPQLEGERVGLLLFAEF